MCIRDRLIDVLEANRAYVPAIYILTKSDLAAKKDLKKISSGYDIAVAAEKDEGMKELKEMIYQRLELINVYTKRKGEEVDLGEPLVVRKGTTMGEVCERLHRDLKKEFRYAMVWGKSVKHQPQRVGLKHVLVDDDIVQIVKR